MADSVQMHYAVTGATGLLGNNIVRKLLDQGHQVRVAVRSTSDRQPLEGLDVEIAVGDLNDAAFAEELLRDVDGLFHSAGLIWIGHQRREESLRVNVGASTSLARQCAANSIRMVYVSSCDALAAASDGRPVDEQALEPPKGKSSYVVSKRQAERELLALCESHSLDLVIVNPGLLIGPFDWKPSTGQMFLSVTRQFVPMAPGGGVSACDVRGVAEGTIRAMTRGQSGQRYILAGENLSYLALWRKMAALNGRRGPLAGMGPVVAWIVGVAGDLWASVRGKETTVNSAAVAQGQKKSYYDSSRAIRHLDYHPGSLDTALSDMWDWFVENGYTEKR